MAVGSRPKVVILDDSAIVRELMSAGLAPVWHAITIETPIGFRNLLKRERPRVALVDVNMPALRGDKLVELAQRGGPLCPILLFSDLPEHELALMAQACNAAGYIRKTGDIAVILQRLEPYRAPRGTTTVGNR